MSVFLARCVFAALWLVCLGACVYATVVDPWFPLLLLGLFLLVGVILWAMLTLEDNRDSRRRR